MSQHHQHHHEPGNHAACIRLVPIFNHLEDDAMDKIAERATTKVFKRSDYLFRAQEKDDTLYIVNRGKVRIFLLSESGKEQLIRILHPGDFMGEWTVFNPGGVHEAYAQATQDTVVCTIGQADIQAFLTDYPTITMKLLAEMSQRLESSERQTVKVAEDQVGNRLIMFLAENVVGPASEQIIELEMTRKDIASYLGTTPETISRKFKELEQAGLIEQLTPKKIKIVDVDELLLYSEQ